jgi:DNA-binding response OmpR family regulator
MEKRPSILIIEPRHSTRTFLEMTLCHEGMRVFSAMNLSSALLQLRVLQPDLIIIGLGRQELEASDAAAQIKALSHSPLLALGHGNGVALGAGFAGVLPYPFGPGQLCAEISGLLGRPCASYPGRSRKVTVGRSTEHLIQDTAWTIGEEVKYEIA